MPIPPDFPCDGNAVVANACVRPYSQDLYDDSSELDFYIVKSKNGTTAIVCLESMPAKIYVAGPFKSYKDASQYDSKLKAFSQQEGFGLPKLTSTEISNTLPQLENRIEPAFNQTFSDEIVVDNVNKVEGITISNELKNKNAMVEENKGETVEVEYKNIIDLADATLRQDEKIKIIPQDSFININKNELTDE